MKNTGTAPYYFVFAGGEDEYGCLDLGTLELKNEKLFLNNVLKWDWMKIIRGNVVTLLRFS